MSTSIHHALLGLAIGDALGVPVEFRSREILQENPVVNMRGGGSHNQAAGTFSDDASLTFCLAEALTQEFDLQKIADNFLAWYQKNYWAARGEVFDIGISTREAFIRLAKGERPDLAGGVSVSSNGNGSLMRILPLIFYSREKSIDERYELTRLVSSITHGHVRSVIACFYYLEFARHLLAGHDKETCYELLQKELPNYLHSREINPDEIALFDRLLKHDIRSFTEKQIKSSGYVLHTIEASIWCLLTTTSFSQAVLKAVNLGDDTDTTGAVTGGLAGLVYGQQNMPQYWLQQLARKKDIEDLAMRLANATKSN